MIFNGQGHRLAVSWQDSNPKYS